MARKKIDDEKFEWFPCYPRNLLEALGGMEADQQHVYLVMLLRIYECWGACRDPRDSLRTRMRLPKKRFDAALGWLLSTGKLVDTGDGIRNPKADTVMAEQDEFSQRTRKNKSEAGKKSAEKRKEKQQTWATAVQQQPTDKRTVDSLEGEESPSTARAPDGGLFPITPPVSEPKLPIVDLKRQLYDQGKLVLGPKSYGSLITALLKKTNENVAIAMAHLTRAAATDSPRGYLSNFISGRTPRAKNAPPSRNGFAAMALEIMEEETNDVATADHRNTIDHDPNEVPAAPSRAAGVASVSARLERKR